MVAFINQIKKEYCLSFPNRTPASSLRAVSFLSGLDKAQAAASAMSDRVFEVSCFVRSLNVASFNSPQFSASEVTNGVSNSFVLPSLLGEVSAQKPFYQPEQGVFSDEGKASRCQA
jgi:hypothetical protein